MSFLINSKRFRFSLKLKDVITDWVTKFEFTWASNGAVGINRIWKVDAGYIWFDGGATPTRFDEPAGGGGLVDNYPYNAWEGRKIVYLPQSNKVNKSFMYVHEPDVNKNLEGFTNGQIIDFLTEEENVQTLVDAGVIKLWNQFSDSEKNTVISLL